jgi:hypothetical protein
MPTLLLLVLIGLTISLIAVFVFRPQITQTLAGKIAAFLALSARCLRGNGSLRSSGFRED